MKKIYIWGTGIEAERCQDKINTDNCEIIGYIETKPSKSFWKEKRVYAPEDLSNLSYDYVIIATIYYEEIVNYIMQRKLIDKEKIVNWMKIQECIYNYNEEIWKLFSCEFIKNNFYIFNSQKRRHIQNLSETLCKYEKIYIYDMRLINCELDIGILLNEILNNLSGSKIGMAFIPNESYLDENWYHNLLYVLDKNAYVIWGDMEGVYADYIGNNPEKFSFLKFGILQFERKQKRIVRKGRYMLFDTKLVYEEKRDLIESAHHVQIYQLRCDRIGEEIRVLNKVLSKNNGEKDIFKLYIPVDDYNRPYDGANACFNELVGRKINLLKNKDEYVYWIQDILENSKKYEWKRRIDVSDIKCGLRNMNDPVIDFYDSELVFGRELIRNRIGLTGEYVSLFVRDAAYLKKLLPEIDCSYNNYRDMSFKIMNKAIDYFDRCGIQTVRMGQISESQEIHSKCIDFAKEGYDEFIDLSILRNNKFFIGTGAGIAELPNIFGKPVLWLLPYYPLIDYGLFYVKECLGIFNRIYSINKKRELAFSEIFDVTYAFKYIGKFRGEYFKQHGLEIIPFSEDDILGAAIEMNEKLDKVWKEQEEDIKLHNIFASKLSSFFNKHKIDVSDMVPINVATSYLRKYKHLLED